MNPRILSLLITALVVAHWPAAHALGQGDAMPDCLLKKITDAQTQSLKQWAGSVLYVDFWASWCGPCAKSFPFLNGLDQQLKASGLQIIGVNMDESLDDAKSFLAKYPASFQVASDTEGQCAKQFDVQAMPSSYLVDKKGIIRAVHLGFKVGEAEALKVLVTQLVAEH